MKLKTKDTEESIGKELVKLVEVRLKILEAKTKFFKTEKPLASSKKFKK